MSSGNFRLFEKIADALIADLKEGLLPNMGSGEHATYNAADASLWFIWALTEYHRHNVSPEMRVWDRYGPVVKSILSRYREGTHNGIRMDSDGLLEAVSPGMALTWMDAVCNGTPVTPRMGKAVELNALWYHAVCFALDLAAESEDMQFVREWKALPELCARSFVSVFWDEGKQYLADCVTDGVADWSVRPNQIFAVSLKYSPLPETIQRLVADKVAEELLTPRGLRTLSAGDPHYHGRYSGNQLQRDQAYHQGTIWPWLLGHFTDAYLRVYGGDALPLLQEIYEGMAVVLEEYGLYSVAELYDGDYPYRPGGTIAQAWSVAELIRMGQTIVNYRAQFKAALINA
ncbi:amylo-alpha-1,6-glucosidase [Chitinophaga pollutisoli]|uniref:Amylo-alpha-1,6-glucosidase n=1 Tax=Chitinophaga pollutisoli TaxID=3133966 RepID=A0ABZ2YWA3_9BACT